MARDLSPLLPEKIRSVFPVRRCGAAPEAGAPKYYTKDVTLSSLSFSDTTITPKPFGINGTTLVLRDTALALYSTGAGPATNQSTLDSLATQSAQDVIDWLSVSFDYAYNGVAEFTPNALVDLIEWSYSATDLVTRVKSSPWNIRSPELSHQDPAVSATGCQKDDRFPGLLIDIPGASSGSSMQGVLTLEDGRLALTYDNNSTLSCGCSPSCGSVCISVTGCGVFYPGVTVSLTKSGSPAGSATTDGMVASISRGGSGTGYTSAPTITIDPPTGGGVTATATCVLSGGGVGTVTLTNPGSGYTTTPNITYTGGGGTGAGANGSITMVAKACIPISSSGTYAYTVTPPSDATGNRFNTATGSVTNSCTGTTTTNTSVALTVKSGYTCCSGVCLQPIATTLFMTNATGTITLTFGGVAWAGTQTVMMTAPSVAPITGNPDCSSPTTQAITVDYSLSCSGLSQQWHACDCCDTPGNPNIILPVPDATSFLGHTGVGVPSWNASYASQCVIPVTGATFTFPAAASPTFTCGTTQPALPNPGTHTVTE